MEVDNQNYFDDFEQSNNNQPFQQFEPSMDPMSMPQNQNAEENYQFQQVSMVDQKREERRQKYLEQEQIRMAQVAEKLNNEQVRKQEIRNFAQQELNDWYSKMQENKNKQREINQAKNIDFMDQQQDSNPWNTIVNNIDLKEQDYQGSKDVTRMKEAILGKQSDLQG